MQKLDDLITFVRVVERGSFIAAARQLGIPPATASRKVQDLEQRLGATLLRRTTRRLVVTDTGREVYDRASQGLSLIDEAELAAKNLTNKPSGVLRVLAPYGLGSLIVDRMLSDFQKLCPEVQIQLILNNEHLDLIEHGFDVALRIGALKNSAYVVRHLLNGERRIIASPDYIEAHGPFDTIDDIENHVFLAATIDPNASGNAYTLTNGREEKHVTLVPRIASNEPSIALHHALRGEGFAILAEFYVRPHLNDGTLKVILPEWHSTEDLQASLIFSRHATNDPKIRMFVDFLSGTSRQLV